MVLPYTDGFVMCEREISQCLYLPCLLKYISQSTSLKDVHFLVNIVTFFLTFFFKQNYAKSNYSNSLSCHFISDILYEFMFWSGNLKLPWLLLLKYFPLF